MLHRVSVNPLYVDQLLVIKFLFFGCYSTFASRSWCVAVGLVGINFVTFGLTSRWKVCKAFRQVMVSDKNDNWLWLTLNFVTLIKLDALKIENKLGE